MSAALLPRLRAAGAEVTLRGNKLVLARASQVPAALLAETRARRDDLLAELERRLDDEYERAERKAIIGQPELPPLGTEARRVIDLNHERMVRGLLAVAVR